MRSIIAAAFLLLILGSCSSVAVFNSPNDMRNMESTLYLVNGDTLHGTLEINNNNFSGKNVKLHFGDDKRPMRFNKNEVKGYELRGDYYALKQIKGQLKIGKEFSFMKRLTPEISKINLYEHLKKTDTDTKGSTSRYETEYFMEIPGDSDGVWEVDGSKFVPNFDKKMSKIVSDCPVLAQKIATKQAGYFYAQVTVFKEKRPEVLLNIIREYNDCK
ncbi:MAG TPA: hypothetical protein VFQ73_04955 [Flavisolibacter sp.]|nr:hypothetical protein [Flavisolibacter sp.]